MSILARRSLMLAATALALLILSVPSLFSASLSLEYYPVGMAFPTSCPNGGSTVITGTEIGKVLYVSIRFTNNGASPIDIGVVTISNLTGCEIPFNETSAATIAGSGATYGAELGVRPTAATWSFTMSVSVTGDSVTSYGHSFSQSAVASGSGSQAEVYWAYSGATKHDPTNRIGYAATGSVVGVPVEIQARTASRSALASLNITTPGWFADPGTTTNATTAIQNQLPSQLTKDGSVITVFTIIPTAAGSFRGDFLCQTDDGMLQVDVIDTATVGTKLRVFLGTREMASNNSQVVIPGTVIGTTTNLTFTIRNDETSTITIGAGISPTYTVGCTTATVTAPSLSLTAGQQTTWVIAVTPTAAQWKCIPTVSRTSGGVRSVPWTLRTDDATAASAPGGSSSGSTSSSSKCGSGSGISALIVLLGLCVVAMRARIKS